MSLKQILLHKKKEEKSMVLMVLSMNILLNLELLVPVLLDIFNCVLLTVNPKDVCIQL